MKCLDCGYSIAPDEVDAHEGHEITEGFFEEQEVGWWEAKGHKEGSKRNMHLGMLTAYSKTDALEKAHKAYKGYVAINVGKLKNV